MTMMMGNGMYTRLYLKGNKYGDDGYGTSEFSEIFRS